MRIIQRIDTKEYMSDDGDWVASPDESIEDQSEFFHNSDAFSELDPTDSVRKYDVLDECVIELVRKPE